MEGHAAASSSRGPAGSPSASATTKRKRPRRNYNVDDRTTKTDVGFSPGTSWTLSSYKPGSGVPELRSPDLTKLWQSDGNQPHLINIQFARRTCVSHISIYLDVKQDDSYTPTKIAIKGGTNYHDLTLVRQRGFDAPQGWKHFSMTASSVGSATTGKEEVDEEEQEEEAAAEGEDGIDTAEVGRNEDGDGEEEEDGGEGIRVWLLQVCILANHLNGKDTHIRRLIVFGPKPNGATGAIGGLQNRLKRGPLANMVPTSAPANRPRNAQATANGGGGNNVTLAQLLSLQEQANAEGEGDADSNGTSSTRQYRGGSGLNLFGNIR